jgi:hypothetical protein
MKVATAAYIAGVFDGEGCFYIERYKTPQNPMGFYYRVMATLTMCDRRTIEFICAETGKQFQIKRLPSGRVAYKVDWRNSIATDFIKAILPYLRGKKEQAEWCIKFNETVSPGRGRPFTAEDSMICEEIRDRLKALKRDPGDLRC